MLQIDADASASTGASSATRERERHGLQVGDRGVERAADRDAALRLRLGKLDRRARVEPAEAVLRAVARRVVLAALRVDPVAGALQDVLDLVPLQSAG